jgi:hypothetical protein
MKWCVPVLAGARPLLDERAVALPLLGLHGAVVGPLANYLHGKP